MTKKKSSTAAPKATAKADAPAAPAPKKAPAPKAAPAPKHTEIKYPGDGLFWKSPIHLSGEYGDPVTGPVLPEHVESMNRQWCNPPKMDKAPDLTAGAGWTLDHDPIAKRHEEARAKMRKNLGLPPVE